MFSVSVKKCLYPVALVLVLVVWWQSVPSFGALYSQFWSEALTMVLGAFVAGSTPMGGGAVAFPVLTKLLDYSAYDARLFSLMIQSVGMTCASLLFIGLGRKIYWRDILAGMLLSGVVVGVVIPFAQVPDALAKSIFTVFELVALGVLIFSLSQFRVHHVHARNAVLYVFAIVGGILSATIGSGADVMMFIYLVAVRKVNPVEAIPTTVVFMALNALIATGVSWQQALFAPPLVTAWLAAVPVVAIAAPLGGFVIGLVPAHWVLRFITVLVIADLTSTLLMSGLPSLFNTLVVAVLLGFVLLKLFRKAESKKRKAEVLILREKSSAKLSADYISI